MVKYGNFFFFDQYCSHTIQELSIVEFCITCPESDDLQGEPWLTIFAYVRLFLLHD